MRSRHLLLFLAFLPIGAAPAGAEVSVVALPSSEQAAKRLAAHPDVTDNQAVFSPTERKILLALGKPGLARALRLTVPSPSAAQELRTWAATFKASISQNSLPVRLESLPSSAEPFQGEQWGLKNSGRAIDIMTDDITTVSIPARAGEDIDWSGAEPRLPPAASGEGPIVAVLDTGIDYEHPDLKGQIVRKPQECEALAQYKECLETAAGKKAAKAACEQKWANVDSDKNGYPLDCSGWNLMVQPSPLTDIQGNPNAADDAGHGTHVSGIIAAAVNGRGIRGIAESARILPIRIIARSPRSPVKPQSVVPDPKETGKNWDVGFADVIARGVLYAIHSGARVINMSLAWPGVADTELIREMIRLAQERGIIVIASAGNDSTDAQVMPCSYDHVICVAAHNPDGKLSRFSNYGSHVELAAPGLWILSTWPIRIRAENFTIASGYEFKNGTSMAAPFVAGAAARLLGGGFSPDETRARLLAGARPLREDDYGKFVRFGNLDLGRSATIAPRPLLLSARKEPVILGWDRTSLTLASSLQLRNYWKEARNVRIRAQVASAAQAYVRTNNTWSFARWGSGETITLPFELQVLDPRMPDEFVLELSVTADGETHPPIPITLSVSVPILHSSQDSEYKMIPLRAGAISPQAILRTVAQGPSPRAASGLPDYIALETTGEKYQLTLLRFSGSSYAVAGKTEIPSSNGRLLSLTRLDWRQDPQDDGYVLLFGAPIKPNNPAWRFLLHYVSPTFQIERSIEYLTSSGAILPNNFSWLSKGGTLTPAWINPGLTPTLEKKPYDPWNPTPANPALPRFYYLNSDGLRTVEPPEGFSFLSTLHPSGEALAKGEIPVLLARADSYRFEYATAVVRSRGSSLTVDEVEHLPLERYHMLGTATAGTVTPLVPGRDSGGTSFATATPLDALHATLLLRDPSNATQVRDVAVSSPLDADPELHLAGSYSSGNTIAGLFAQTPYDLRFHDLNTGESARISLRRFSLILEALFMRTFLPVVAEDSATGKRLPAILLSGDISGEDTVGVALPRYDSSGKLQNLHQPARLRFAGTSECQRIGNPVEATAKTPSIVGFFCGDHFIFAPLVH